jgi:hypothetical protein
MIGNIVAGAAWKKRLLPYKDTVLEDNPVGFWLLDEASGTTMTDYSTSAINGTYYNTPLLNQAGNSGGILKSVSFTGADSENGYTNATSILNFASSANWSMEIWFKDNTTNNTTIETIYVVRGDTTFNDDVVGLIALNNSVAGRIQLFTPNTTGINIVLTYDRTADTNWHQIVATATSGGAVRLYFDGVEQASSTTARNTTVVNKRGIVGSNWTGSAGTQFSTLNLAAASVYNTTLSAERITEHYNAGK